MLPKEYTYVVIGASNNPDKYGHKVAKDLLERGYKVFLINPKEETILGQKVYKNMPEVELDGHKIDCAVFVVPPYITLEIIKKISTVKLKLIWMQPGSESEQAIKLCEEKGMK